MKGSIYSDEKCPICSGSYRYEDRRNGLFCPDHPEQKAQGKFRVRFGKIVKKRFGNDFLSAERFLSGIRYETDKGTFDVRDYKAGHQLGFTTLAEKWLSMKEKSVKYGTFKSIRPHMRKAMAIWEQKNIKTIQFAEIEDFFNAQTDIKKKTLHNMRSCLNDFFNWVELREDYYNKPRIPDVNYTMGTRDYISIADQRIVLDEVKRIAPYKTWLGIRWLCIYIKFRPGELVQLKEKNIINGVLTLEPNSTKEKKLKRAPLIEEDIEILANTPKGFAEQYFFRHEKGGGKAKKGSQYGNRYFYKWWVKACENIGIKGVDLYGGTRHSTVTALSQHFSADEIKEYGTGHETSKAFERYFQAELAPSKKMYEIVGRNLKTEKPPQKVVSLNDYR